VSLNQSTNKEVEKLADEHESLLEVIERVQDYWNTQSAELKASSKELADLEDDLVIAKEAQDILESRVKGKRQDLVVKRKTVQELEDSLDALAGRLADAEDRHRIVRAQLTEKEEELSDKRDLLEALREDQKDLMDKLEAERLDLREQHDFMISKYHAIRFLLRENFVEAPEAKILKALEGKTSVNIDELKRETSLTTYRVEKAVKLLTERGVLEYSTTSGEITVKREILI
jgi:chromosome segregation ATPase